MPQQFYAELGQNTRDVFGKGYSSGFLKLEVKTKSDNGVEFSTGGMRNLENENVGNLETKYKHKEYGVTFMEKYNTNNILTTQVALSDFYKGAKISCDTSFAPLKGDKTLKLTAEFRNDFCALNLNTNFKQGGPIIKGGAVLGHGGWLFGVASAFDVSKSKFTENKFSIGFCTKDFNINTNINDGRLIGGSIFHKVNQKLETAIQISRSLESGVTELGIGCKYNLNKDSSLRLKVNNQSIIGLGYTQNSKEGVIISLFTQIDGKQFKEGGPSIGMRLKLEV